ncbi:MAG: helix-turn-helix domain-containing protein [Sinimarinibacterium flocculans]|uniref:helix-turn-helix domain-containing protein n=1 Tax=Sinimarinibacterium flocculans TaxID=985250 RepID=UPI003C4B9D9F
MQKHPALVALGKRIRELRQERGYSQEDFANEIGLDRSYYGGIERGERNVAALNLILIAKKLKAEVGDLFPDIGQLPAPRPRRRGAQRVV